MSATLFQSLSRGLADLLAPLGRVADDPESLNRLLAELGVLPQEDNQALIAALRAVAQLRDRIEALSAQGEPSLENIAAVLDDSESAFTALRRLHEAGGPLSALEGAGRDLATLLIAGFLDSRFPVVRPLLALLTLLEPAEEQEVHPPVIEGGQLVRAPYALDRFHLDRLPDLLRDPVVTLRAEYGSPLATVNEANALADRLFLRLTGLLRALGVSCRYGIDPDDEAALGDAAPLMDHALILYADDPLNGVAASGVALSLSSADRGDLGLVVKPFGALTFTRPAGLWMLEVKLTAGVDVVAWGRHGVTLLASAATTEAAGSVSAALAAPDEGPAFVFGAPDGTRLEVGGALIRLETALSQARQSLAASAAVSRSAIVLAPGDSDSFLASFLPAEGLRARFDLGLAWSSERGLSLEGAAGLEAVVPLGLSLGPVRLPTLYLGLRASDAGMRAEVSASVGLSIGPVHALVDRVGLAATTTFPEDGGNLGVADLTPGFQWPRGAGITVDAPSVSGGGFLFFDPAAGQYAGIVQLNIEGGLTVTALGLISTRLPGGAKGFSFLLLITAQDFKPIPIGLGFTLTGIGGLLAINRTCNEAALREGLKNNTLNALLFPKDPVRNAPLILGALNAVFPPRDGSYLFGPVAQICWGTPPLLTMNLALILELGSRTRLIILGRISAILPSEKHDLIRLQMNTVGIVDFDQKSMSLDAVLFDSRLVGKFPLTGSMAMRLHWGASPQFALSVGGFHPAFRPPSGFPTLARITLSLSDSANFRLRCHAYFAITANTLQFGAHAELLARAGDFRIEGRVGFDVLIQFDPFGFLAAFYAGVQLKRGSTNLFKVQVQGELAGPRPLHVRGKATFEIFWCDFSVRFDRTLISGQAPPKPAPVLVLEQLKAALNDPRNWGGQLAEGERRLATLREAQPANQIALHPLGRLSVKQNVVPLELEIARFGNARPADARFFRINRVFVGDSEVTFERVRDFFAPSQFLDLSDEEKLAAPAFDSQVAGMSVDGGGFVFPAAADDVLEDEALTFETIIVDKDSDQSRSTAPFALGEALLREQIRFGAAAQSAVRRTGGAKYRPEAGKNTPVPKGWRVVSSADGTARAAPGLPAGSVATYAESFQALQELGREAPARAKELMLVPVSR